MTDYTKEIAALEQPLNARHVSQRKGAGGMTLDYIQAHHAIREANRIFGHDGWSRETREVRHVWTGDRRGKTAVACIATVRVHALGVHRDGTGYGDGLGPDEGVAFELAAKEAESDAMKRALMTFGDPFGLALYDKERKHVSDEPEPVTDDDVKRVCVDLESCADAKELKAEWIAHNPVIRRMTDEQFKIVNAVKDEMKAKFVSKSDD